MSATLDELERLLNLLINEQKRQAELLTQQKTAMSSLNADETVRIANEQEQARTRLAAIETRRKALSLQAVRELRINLPPNTAPTLAQIAAAVPDVTRRNRLLAARQELRKLAEQVSAASHVTGRLAGAMLGHLNTAMRLLAGAMRDAGTYTRSGTTRFGSGTPARIGVVEAVG